MLLGDAPVKYTRLKVKLSLEMGLYEHGLTVTFSVVIDSSHYETNKTHECYCTK